MQLLRIQVKNFGPHLDTCINFEDGLNAIVAPVGTGKTFILESISAILYGSWPSRNCPVGDGISWNHIGDAYLSAAIKMGDSTYLLERKFRKTKSGISHDAYLSCDDKPLAGPKVKDFEAVVVTIFGSKEVFLASVFAAQDDRGDLTSVGPTDRKKILAEPFGLTEFQEKADAINVFARDLIKQKESLIASNENLEQLVPVIDYSALPVLRERIQQHRDSIAQQDAPMLQEEQALKDLNAKISSYEERKKFRGSLLTEIDNIDDWILEYNSKKENIPDLLEAVRVLEKEISLNAEHKSAEENRRVLLEANNKDKQEKYNADFLTYQKDLERISSVNLDMQKAFDGLKDKFVEYRNKKDNYDRACKLLDTGDFTHDACKACRFVSDAITTKDEFEKLVVIIAPTPPELLPTPFPPPAPELEGFTEKSMLYPDASFDFLNNKQKLNEFKSLSVQLPDKQKRYEELQRQLTGYPEEDVSKIQTQIDEREENISQIKLNVLSWNNLILDLEKQISAIETKMQECEKINKKIKENASLIAKHVHTITIAQYVHRFYGRDGIQALILDAAIPRMHVISDELLGILTGGKMSLSFSTVHQKKDGKEAEGFDILVATEDGSYDVSQFSGGQKTLLKTVLRITLAIDVARNSLGSGERYRTLFLDEAFKHLDRETKQRMMNMLYKLKDYFKQVIFITHDDELFESVENIIYLKEEMK